MEGNAEVIWGFLDDIWHWHFNKISPFDPANNGKREQTSVTPTREEKQGSIKQV
jgi:hypothetical protein